MESKKTLRKNMIEERRKLSEEELKKFSQSITEHIMALDEFNRASTIMVYLSVGEEVDTHDLISQALNCGKTVAVPKVDLKSKTMEAVKINDWDNDLQEGVYGILEPKPHRGEVVTPDSLDLVIVPGLVFDRQGYRIGYGGGFYDGFISRVSDNTSLIAVSYQFQLIDQVPREQWDQAVDKLITEHGVTLDNTESFK